MLLDAFIRDAAVNGVSHGVIASLSQQLRSVSGCCGNTFGFLRSSHTADQIIKLSRFNRNHRRNYSIPLYNGFMYLCWTLSTCHGYTQLRRWSCRTILRKRSNRNDSTQEIWNLRVVALSVSSVFTCVYTNTHTCTDQIDLFCVVMELVVAVRST